MSGVRFINTDEQRAKPPTWHAPEPEPTARLRSAKLRLIYAACDPIRGWDARRYGPGNLRLLVVL